MKAATSTWNGAGMEKIKIEEWDFLAAIMRDDESDPTPRRTFLDRTTGEIIWLYDDWRDAYREFGADDAVEERNRLRQIQTAPTRFLEIPPRSHEDHHDILQAFIESEEWTDDEARKLKARSAYHGSIGGWIKEVGDQSIVDAYQRYRSEDHAMHLATRFLHDHGIDPEWT
jgi:hypothetical protein